MGSCAVRTTAWLPEAPVWRRSNGRAELCPPQSLHHPVAWRGIDMDDVTQPCAAGLEAVLLANRPRLLSFFTSRTRDPAEAEAILAEIRLQLGRADPGPVADPLGHIYRVGLDLAVDRARPSRFDAPPASRRRARIAGVLASMPSDAARAFQLHRVEGLANHEVAVQLGITRKGVEKHMAAAFRHLAKELQE